MASNRWSKNRKFAHEYKSIGSYDVEQRPGETDMQYYRRLAKVADQRLVRLEALSHEQGFKGVRKMAYARAMEDLQIFGGGKRFNTAPVKDAEGKIDRRLFNEKIMAMRYFIQSPTSTRTGIIETYQKRAEELNKNYGTDFTWKDLSDYFGKKKNEKLMRATGAGSKTVLTVIGTIGTLAKDLRKKLSKGVETNTNVTVAGPVTDTAIDLLRRRTIPGITLTTEERRQIREMLQA